VKKLIILTLVLCATYASAKHEFHHPSEFVDKIKADKNKGEKIYASFCANCHAKDPLINLGAPRLGVKAEWTKRLEQKPSELFKHVSEGMGVMPARGGCFECDDAMLKEAIAYLLPKKDSKKRLNLHQVQ